MPAWRCMLQMWPPAQQRVWLRPKKHSAQVGMLQQDHSYPQCEMCWMCTTLDTPNAAASEGMAHAREAQRCSVTARDSRGHCSSMRSTVLRGSTVLKLPTDDSQAAAQAYCVWII